MINRQHWQYFLSLEQEIIKISHFISIDKRNFDTFSLELLKIYLSVCSEVDVVARLLSKKIDLESYREKTENEKRLKNMDTYRNIINLHYPGISKVVINIDLYKINFNPWNKFSKNENPEWWQQYNKAKHTREEFFHQANLGNTLNSLSGLLVLLNYYCHPMNHESAYITLDDSTTPRLMMIEGKNVIPGASWEGTRIYLPEQEILNK